MLGALRPTLSCHDQEKPALLTLGACLQPHRPSGSPPSPGLQDCSAQPATHPRCTCFYLLRAGRTWCMEGRAPPTLSAPHQHRTGTTGGCPGWHLLRQQRVKANLPRLTPHSRWAAAPRLALSNRILALL